MIHKTTKELLINNIHNAVCFAERVKCQFIKCDDNDKIRLKHLSDSVEHYEKELNEAIQLFLTECPDDKERIEKFVSDIRCYERLIIDKEEEIERYKNRQIELKLSLLSLT